MDKYDFIKLFSAMLLETDNPYFRKKDLGRFLYDHYDDPEYNNICNFHTWPSSWLRRFLHRISHRVWKS